MHIGNKTQLQKLTKPYQLNQRRTNQKLQVKGEYRNAGNKKWEPIRYLRNLEIVFVCWIVAACDNFEARSRFPHFLLLSLLITQTSLSLSLADKTALCWCGVCECGNASSLRSTDPNTLLKSSELFYLESAIYQVRCALFVEEGLQIFIGKWKGKEKLSDHLF